MRVVGEAGLPSFRGCGPLPAFTLRLALHQGKPKPQASWTHDGHTLDTQRVNVRSGEQDSILFIRSAQRCDSGRYELTVRLEDLEAKAAIDILVIGKGARVQEHPAWQGEWGMAHGAWQEPHQAVRTGRQACRVLTPMPCPLVLQRNLGPPAASSS